jgi:uncharacterized protein YcbX
VFAFETRRRVVPVQSAFAENGGMDADIRLARIEIFPIKSLDGLCLTESSINEGGILLNDRVYAMFDGEGAVVNGKRTARVHDLRCEYALSVTEISLWEQGQSSRVTFSLREPEPINRWLSAFFGFEVHLRHEPRRGFSDDPEAYGPTLVSEASLRTVQSWYPDLSLANVRRRFRTNLEIEGGPAFCEDALFGAPGERKEFRLGAVSLLGHNPCQRCVVPTRDPVMGQVVSGFQKSFATHRARALPAWADARRFNHFYRFALNTSIAAAEAGKRLRLGDSLMAA